MHWTIQPENAHACWLTYETGKESVMTLLSELAVAVSTIVESLFSALFAKLKSAISRYFPIKLFSFKIFVQAVGIVPKMTL